MPMPTARAWGSEHVQTRSNVLLTLWCEISFGPNKPSCHLGEGLVLFSL
jgi:hypothetical protein